MTSYIKKLVLATHNKGKIRELKSFLAEFDMEIMTASDLGIIPPEENGTSFEENALIKAKNVALASKLPALADDGGLSIDILGGRPGIYSARWCGINRNFAAAFTRIKKELNYDEANPKQYIAKFTSVLSLCFPDGSHQEFKGVVRGNIDLNLREVKSDYFGYDPIFIPEGYGQTFAQLGEIKQKISHRAQAFKQLKQFLQNLI